VDGTETGICIHIELASKTEPQAAFGAASLPQKAKATNGLTGGSYLTLLYIITRANIY
jgi:hypothetical protein